MPNVKTASTLIQPTLVIVVVFLLSLPQPTYAQSIRSISAVFNVGRNHSTRVFSSTTTLAPDDHTRCALTKPCRSGLLLPVWLPQDVEFSTKCTRALIYFLSLVYLFFGVSIVSDRFMAAIEMITSQERTVKIRKANGQVAHVLARVWNKTVSNLTLMVLGSSAPEILLPIIEIFGNHFEAGDLGPSTIVGSAAFNLFIIIAVCILAVPSSQVRKVYRVDVYWVTVFWSTFAYIWLFAIIAVFSPGVVELWEGVVTFFCFPLTVITAFVCDKHAPVIRQHLLNRNVNFVRNRRGRTNGQKKSNGFANGKVEAEVEKDLLQCSPIKSGPLVVESRQQYMQIFRKLRVENPDLDIRELENIASEHMVREQPKSRAFYRIQATRKMVGAGEITRKLRKKSAEPELPPLMPEKPKEVSVEFQLANYICLENVGKIELQVVVDRGSISLPTVVTVDYHTVADSAQEYEDFMPIKGTLRFEPAENMKPLHISIVDNDVYEEDEQFFVQLSHLHAFYVNNPAQRMPSRLGAAATTTVLIVDDDHGGAFSFDEELFKVPENAGVLTLNVCRHRGARGAVSLPFHTADGLAKDGSDYVGQSGDLQFRDGQSRAQIEIEIINDDEYEKTEDFYVELGEPVWHLSQEQGQADVDGRPVLGAHSRCKVLITEDKEFKGFVDKMLTEANTLALVGSSSWRQQFADALEVEDLDGDGSLSKREHLMHYISLPWKLLFAFVPPTDYFNGWLCFVVSLLVIGILTAFIGDVAALFGCTLGIADSVTAITLVAIGTSLPDTFASVTAARMDRTADSSVGNVAGSNAVNVFLGIGMAWLCAAIYHAFNGTELRVKAGALTSSVVLFMVGSMVCFGLLQWRRMNSQVGGELGGPTPYKTLAFAIFLACWFIFILYSTLVAYCLVPGF